MSSNDQSELAHMVFFSFKEPTPAAQQSLIDACQKYLTDHLGTVHFSVGPRAIACDRPVNDTEFDVALLLVFASEADHDRYQSSDRHQEFIASQKDAWSQVRVFDSLG